MRLRLALLLMHSPSAVWTRLPRPVRDWCITQWMRQFPSVQRLGAEQ